MLVSRKKREKEKLSIRSKKSPLQYLVTQQIQDSKGRIVAQIAPIEEGAKENIQTQKHSMLPKHRGENSTSQLSRNSRTFQSFSKKKHQGRLVAHEGVWPRGLTVKEKRF